MHTKEAEKFMNVSINSKLKEVNC